LPYRAGGEARFVITGTHIKCWSLASKLLAPVPRIMVVVPFDGIGWDDVGKRCLASDPPNDIIGEFVSRTLPVATLTEVRVTT
jgi:hypothetical protein